ncbi:TPA: hypothetical protein ACKRXW_000738 [Proteus mirabilis]|uniref:hypothetical protein n=1 Tax=Proteus mirabilis TaxID=584 RepID=UPI0005383628|nr:hypothetical protein [Proteus mirabilis]AUT91687.1 hypothetical protein MC46_008170 [Proteus mirabilis]ELA7716321.1 hypothetical protein [Proteus mirabilis]EMA1123014.1 hypothetical protein [Proteus mirabilis]KSW20442.1 hypothetical protein OJ22_05475 [Proteus mirabilis]KXB99024.1 hypothetical protein HMPREF3203_03444 [Proteus mirabilis]
MNKKKAISQYENLMSQYQKLRGNIKVPDEISIDEVKQWLLDVSSFMHNYFPEKKQYKVDIEEFNKYEELYSSDHKDIEKVILAVGCELSSVSSKLYDN